MKQALIQFLFILILISPTLSKETIQLSTGEWAPFTSQNHLNGNVAQIIVNEAFKLVDIEVKYTYYPWKRAFILAKRVDADGTFPWRKNKQREADFFYSKQAIIKSPAVFFHLKKLDLKWENYQDLKKYKIGGTLSYTTVPFLEEKGLTVEVVPQEAQNFKKILAGRIDITPSSLLVGYAIIHKIFPKDKASMFTHHPRKLTIGDDGLHLLISKKHSRAKELMKKFDEGLNKLIISGRYDKIMTSFIQKYTKQ